MKIPARFLLLPTLFILSLGPLLAGDNLLTNGDFESGEGGWAPFIPEDAKNSDCKYAVTETAPHGGAQAGEISCATDARFAIVTYVKGHEFANGTRYRVSAWVKTGADFQPAAGTPGYVLRISMFADEGTTQGTDDSLFYLGTGNTAVRSADASPLNNQDCPKEWTRLEGVFDVSPGTAKLNVCLFIWKGTGSMFIDDVVLEQVDESVPVSPVTTP